jgi:hypothetical protein
MTQVVTENFTTTTCYRGSAPSPNTTFTFAAPSWADTPFPLKIQRNNSGVSLERALARPADHGEQHRIWKEWNGS